MPSGDWKSDYRMLPTWWYCFVPGFKIPKIRLDSSIKDTKNINEQFSNNPSHLLVPNSGLPLIDHCFHHVRRRNARLWALWGQTAVTADWDGVLSREADDLGPVQSSQHSLCGLGPAAKSLKLVCKMERGTRKSPRSFTIVQSYNSNGLQPLKNSNCICLLNSKFIFIGKNPTLIYP